MGKGISKVARGIGKVVDVAVDVVGGFVDAIGTALGYLISRPRELNFTREAIIQQAELERQHREELDRVAREARETAERLHRELEQQAAEERERLERQHREEMERYQREQQESAAQELQRTEEEIRIQHEQQMRTLTLESEARLAEQREEAARVLQEQEVRAHTQQEEASRKLQELESKLLAGIQPEVWPTPEERKHAENRLLEPRSELFHCAIAGLAGSGKSSLINAFRGLRNKSSGAARTGVRETTLTITGYRDPSTTLPRSRFVWYDIPGAGTLSIPGWQYFNSQGLFVFDLIIVVTDNRFSEGDITILKQCERYKIPSFVVRSKANQHIENLMEQEYEWEGADDERDFDEVYRHAREMLVSETRASTRENLQVAELDAEKEVFIVSCDALASLVREEMGRLKGKNQLIDEPKLLLKCLEAVRARRY